MLILMALDAPRNDIDRVKEKIKSFNCQAHEIPGASKLAIGLTGPTAPIKEEEFQVLPGVQEVIRITKKYKLVSRQMKPDNTRISVRGETIGAGNLTIIAGPCSVESREQIFDIAGSLSEMGIRFLRAGAYKPRSSPYSFQGLRETGILYLSEVRKETGMGIVTEVLDVATLENVAEVADIIQIGARNMRNFPLLEAVGKLGKPVLLKRGMSARIEDLLLSAEYIVYHDNFNVILCERGIRTFETATRNTLDLNAVPVIQSQSHLPVFVDPSHGIGIGDMVPQMALAAVACGADGLLIEVHPQPETALSDGYQSLNPPQFRRLMDTIIRISTIIGKRFNG